MSLTNFLKVNMSIIEIIYHSGSEFSLTKQLAQNISEGLRLDSSIEVNLSNVKNLKDSDWERFDQANALIFGSPTYMGGVSSEFKAFMDKTGYFWVEQKWADKIAAGFTISSGPSGDKLSTLSQLSIFAAQHGMVWIGLNHVGSLHTGDDEEINECGSWLGMMATSNKNNAHSLRENDIKTSHIFGERIASAVKRWG